MATKDKPLTLEELIAAGPPVASGPTQNLPSPIGVPEYLRSGDTVVPFEANGIPPRYFEGDQYAQLASLTPEDIARLQMLMVNAGVIPRGTTFRRGRMDDTTVAAWSAVLTHANRTGTTPSQALRDLQDSATETRPTPDPYLRPDPATVRQGVMSKFKDLLGRDVTEGELPGLVDTYLKVDKQRYDAEVAAEAAATTGATETQAVDPAARFTEMLEQKYKPEMERTKGVIDLSQNREKLMSNIFALDQAIR